jgi:hypothetical protein
LARTRYVRRSCALSSLTNSVAHSRASSIFPASRKARAFASAWLSADRSFGDSLPACAARVVRVPDDVLRMAVQFFSRRQISTGFTPSRPASRRGPPAGSRTSDPLRATRPALGAAGPEMHCRAQPRCYPVCRCRVSNGATDQRRRDCDDPYH